jgi:CubicO group peptidase (beta-lactamase class C family)
MQIKNLNNYHRILLLSLVIFILIGANSFVYGQNDSAIVYGHLIWKEKSIPGFPSKINITEKGKSSLLLKAVVDSSGKYSVTLPLGTYNITPSLSYHWAREHYIRIDNDKSQITVTVKSNKDVVAPILEIDTIALPVLIPEKGILYDFNNERAILLDNFIKKYQEYYGIPGVSLALIKNGQVVYCKTYGIKNTDTKELVNEETLFEAGSVTKTMFTFAVMRLVEKGILDLDKPLYQYLPFEDVAHDERYKLITARLVLIHQTGFPNWANRNEKGQFDLMFTPGTKFGYSGEGFEYLKRVVEHITKKGIGVILEEELINPLNLKNIYFQKNDYLLKVAANGHIDNAPTNLRLIDSPKVAYGMYTEAKSFAPFILALSNRKGLKSETYNEMFKIQTIIPKNESEKKNGWDVNAYRGLGFELEKSPYGLVIGHGGSTSTGFTCYFNLFQDLNMGYIIFTNSDTGGLLVQSPIMEFLITGKEKK